MFITQARISGTSQTGLKSLADYAYDLRRLDRWPARVIACRLVFSDRFETDGQFYEALSINQFGRKTLCGLRLRLKKSPTEACISFGDLDLTHRVLA